jgi:nucleoside-diphosphate kinase
VGTITEKTLILIKPDGIRRGLIGDIIKVFEDNYFFIEALRMFYMKKEDAKEFYSVHKGKYFYEDLINYITSGRIVGIIVFGENAINRAREIVGNTDPYSAKAGTIRRKYGLTLRRNTIHASDCLKSSRREIKIVFGDDYQI